MLGHAFDAYGSATALIEGNVFESVDQPITDQGASIDTIYNVVDDSAASACSSYIGRDCVINSLTSSGDWPSLSSTSAFDALSSVTDYLVTPIDASEVKEYVTSNAGPAYLSSYTGISGSSSSSSSSSSSYDSSNSTTVEDTSSEDTSSSEDKSGSTAASSSYATSAAATASAQATGSYGGYGVWGSQGSGGWGQPNSNVGSKGWRMFRA